MARHQRMPTSRGRIYVRSRTMCAIGQLACKSRGSPYTVIGTLAQSLPSMIFANGSKGSGADITVPCMRRESEVPRPCCAAYIPPTRDIFSGRKRRNLLIRWCRRVDSNHRPADYESAYMAFADFPCQTCYRRTSYILRFKSRHRVPCHVTK